MTMASSLRSLGRMAMDAIRPHGVMDAVWDYAPDLAFAAVAGTHAKPGWAPALIGEDLALGLGASMIGRMGGEVVGRKFMGIDPLTEAGQQRLGQLRMAGSMALSMGPALAGFRPITQKMIEAEQKDAEQQQALMAEEENRHLKEQMIGAGFNGLGMVTRGPWDTLGGLPNQPVL